MVSKRWKITINIFQGKIELEPPLLLSRLRKAIKLPLIAYCLDRDRQGELIEMREIWYGDRPLNIWTHMSVGLKTQQYLIYDHFWFWLRQKVEDRWQPMNRERLPRIKNSD